MSQSGKNITDDEDYVSAVTMRDMMAQQNLFYEEMLSRQEANFMSFKKMILESTTKRNDGIMKEEEEGRISAFNSLGFTEMEKKVGLF